MGGNCSAGSREGSTMNEASEIGSNKPDAQRRLTAARDPQTFDSR
jgi:hypothetical protein